MLEMIDVFGQVKGCSVYACVDGVHYLRGNHEGGQCFAASVELA